MFPAFRSMVNCHAFKALTKSPEIPNPALAVAGADEMSNVPLLIFREQGTMNTTPVKEHIYNMSYEQTAVKGAGDTLSMENFVTDDFDLGAAYDFLT